jgi:hypothetical protein
MRRTLFAIATGACAVVYVMGLVSGIVLIISWLRGRYGIRRLGESEDENA